MAAKCSRLEIGIHCQKEIKKIRNLRSFLSEHKILYCIGHFIQVKAGISNEGRIQMIYLKRDRNRNRVRLLVSIQEDTTDGGKTDKQFRIYSHGPVLKIIIDIS